MTKKSNRPQKKNNRPALGPKAQLATKKKVTFTALGMKHPASATFVLDISRPASEVLDELDVYLGFVDQLSAVVSLEYTNGTTLWAFDPLQHKIPPGEDAAYADKSVAIGTLQFSELLIEDGTTIVELGPEFGWRLAVETAELTAPERAMFDKPPNFPMLPVDYSGIIHPSFTPIGVDAYARFLNSELVPPHLNFARGDGTYLELLQERPQHFASAAGGLSVTHDLGMPTINRVVGLFLFANTRLPIKAMHLLLRVANGPKVKLLKRGVVSANLANQLEKETEYAPRLYGSESATLQRNEANDALEICLFAELLTIRDDKTLALLPDGHLVDDNPEGGMDLITNFAAEWVRQDPSRCEIYLPPQLQTRALTAIDPYAIDPDAPAFGEPFGGPLGGPFGGPSGGPFGAPVSANMDFGNFDDFGFSSDPVPMNGTITHDDTAHVTFEITLNDVQPPVRRTMSLPANLDLTTAIENTLVLFGWELSHLWELSTPDRKARFTSNKFEPIPGGKFWEAESLQLSQVFVPGDKLVLEYDFGDGWEMTIDVKEINNRERGAWVDKAKNHCPLEDVGGPFGWGELRTLMKDKEKFKKDNPHYSEEDVEMRYQWGEGFGYPGNIPEVGRHEISKW